VLDAVVAAVTEFGAAATPATEGSICAALDLGATGAVDEWSATRRTWVLDPIDGTKGFMRGDQFAVALALLEGGRPVLGLLGCPRLHAGDQETGSIFWAARGNGAFRRPVECNGDDATGLPNEAMDERIRVEPEVAPDQVIRCEAYESGHTSHDRSAAAVTALGYTLTPIRIDGQGKYGLVASGEAHVYMRLPRAGYVENIWDHAAGVCVIEEAGGRVSDTEGRPLDFSRGARLSAEVTGIVATNGVLHDKLLDALREADRADASRP